jgi:hypothetical protein
MIQRIQTLYMFIAAIASGVVIFFLSLWKDVSGNEFLALDLLEESSFLMKMIPVLLLLSAVMSLLSISMFGTRKRQFVLNRLNILINLILLGVLIYHLLTLSGEAKVSEKGIGAVLPVVVILFLAIANRAIKKDEDLVKSVDRLR